MVGVGFSGVKEELWGEFYVEEGYGDLVLRIFISF